MRNLAGFWVGALVALSGCNCGNTYSEACAADRDCSAGLVCVAAQCRPAGVADGGDTDGGTDQSQACVTQCGDGCCTAGERCEANECHKSCDAAQTRCGDLGAEVCCNAGDLCYLGACVTPGAVCTTAADCQSTEYCDTSVNRCLPRGSGGTCEYHPSGTFAPATLWNAEVTTDAYTQVMMSPVVIDVNGDNTPDVLANYFAGSGYGAAGVMRALNGATGATLWSSADVVTDNVHPAASIAAGILRAGGPMLAITQGANGQLVAFNAANGSVVWRSHDSGGAPVNCNLEWGGASIADLNADGVAEVVCGFQAFDDQGLQLFNGGAAAGAVGPITVVADLDSNGQLDISDGARAMRGDGTAFPWTGSGMGGLPAVGDFVNAAGQPGQDGKPELAVVGGGQIALVNGQTGELIVPPSALPSWSGSACVVGGGVTGTGGAPTIADFDGDHQPEIGVANLSCYSVFKLDATSGTLKFSTLWSRHVQDQSSSVTGSSVFDFQGDGRAEVVYADEVLLHVFDGLTGSTLFEQPHCSGTTYEYPLVVDVNGNGRADIVISENNYAAGVLGCAAGATAGIHVFHDAADNWVNTRAIWNEHAYHVTNVCDGVDPVCGGPGAPGNTYGRIPTQEPSNWASSTLNNYRQNVQGTGLFNAPDLTGKDLKAVGSGCPGTMTLSVRVVNEGALGVLAGMKVAFYEDVSPRKLLGVTQTAGKLLPGQSEIVSIQWTPASGQTLPTKIVAAVDDDGTGLGASSECDEANNLVGPITATCTQFN